jgi:penicillin G amidase
MTASYQPWCSGQRGRLPHLPPPQVRTTAPWPASGLAFQDSAGHVCRFSGAGARGVMRRSPLFVIAWMFLLVVIPVYGDRSEWGEVEVVRDNLGVPHIFAKTDPGAMYGLGYAHAEDRAFQMYYSLRIMQGRVSELLGNITKLNGRDTALEHDRKIRTIGYYRAALEVASNLDPDTRQLLEAYSAGVNDYVRVNRGRLLYLFETLELQPEPWTPADCIVSWWHIAQFFGGDGLRDLFNLRQASRLAAEGPRTVDDAAAVIQRSDIEEAWLEKANEFLSNSGVKPEETRPAEAPKFSHAWVVGGPKSTSGAAVLMSDPQTPVRNPSLFHEFHIKGKSFNARGIGVAGSPLLLIGFNEHLAWGITALGADQSDLFLLETSPVHPDSYLLDGKWRRIKRHEETIAVKNGASETLVVRETSFGPVVSEFALERKPEEEVALKRIPIDEKDRDTVQAGIAMMRSTNVAQFGRALEHWRFPSANLVVGDRAGSIAYWTIGAIPVRSAHSSSNGSLPHPGNSAKYDWQGILPWDLMPHVVDPPAGLLFSGNHRPIASFYQMPMGLSTGAGGDTVRSRRLRERLVAKASFTPEEVLDIHYDSVNANKRDFVRLGFHMRDTLRAALSPGSTKTLAHLEEWVKSGYRSDFAIPGTEVLNAMPVLFREGTTPLTDVFGGGEGGLSYFLKHIEARLARNPQADLTEDEKDFVDRVLTGAWEACVQKYGEDSEKWHQQALREVESQTLDYFVGLDGFPALDSSLTVRIPRMICTDGGTILSQLQQSYTQWVPLHDPDSARSILPIGSSEHPDSPFRLVNLEAWAKGELHPAPLSEKAVRKYAVQSIQLNPRPADAGRRRR